MMNEGLTENQSTLLRLICAGIFEGRQSEIFPAIDFASDIYSVNNSEVAKLNAKELRLVIDATRFKDGVLPKIIRQAINLVSDKVRRDIFNHYIEELKKDFEDRKARYMSLVLIRTHGLRWEEVEKYVDVVVDEKYKTPSSFLLALFDKSSYKDKYPDQIWEKLATCKKHNVLRSVLSHAPIKYVLMAKPSIHNVCDTDSWGRANSMTSAKTDLLKIYHARKTYEELPKKIKDENRFVSMRRLLRPS